MTNQLTTSEIFYSMAEETQNLIIFELRKFFAGLPPYLPPKFPLGVIPPDLTYAESAPGVPLDTSGIIVSDEENFDDRKIPCIILTGSNGPSMELGIGQHGLKVKQTEEPNPNLSNPVDVCTTIAGDLTSSFCAGQVVDGIALTAGMRILINNQVNPSENGIYDVSVSGAPTRSTDFNESSQFLYLSTFFVQLGIINHGLYYSQVTNPPIVLGGTPLAYNNLGLNKLRWNERVGAQEITINFAIRGQTTSQRVRLGDLVKLAMGDRDLVRGEIEKKSVLAMPPFIRSQGLSEEFNTSASSKMIYKEDFSMQFFCQWVHRTLVSTFKVHEIVVDPMLTSIKEI